MCSGCRVSVWGDYTHDYDVRGSRCVYMYYPYLDVHVGISIVVECISIVYSVYDYFQCVNLEIPITVATVLYHICVDGYYIPSWIMRGNDNCVCGVNSHLWSGCLAGCLTAYSLYNIYHPPRSSGLC